MVTKRKPLAPVNANRSEMDAYARKAGGLLSTGPNMGAATRNRMTPPTTQVPTVPSTPGTASAEGSDQAMGPVQTPSGPIVTVSVLDVGACKVGDQVTLSVLSVQNGQVSLGNPLVLPGTPAGVSTSQGSGALQ
jgi:hypothetical protein